jgi:hypothetical protein
MGHLVDDGFARFAGAVARRRRVMPVVVFVASGVLALASPGIGTARKRAPKPLQVTYDHWVVTGSTSGNHTAKPGGAVTHCASDPVRKMLAYGRVVRAVKNETDDLVWLYNGHLAYHFKWTWLFNGKRRTSMGIASPPPYSYPDGKYVLKLTHAGKTLGTSSVTLTTDRRC